MTDQLALSIVDFLRKRLAEDEDAAEAARDLMDEPWKILPEGPEEENYSGEYRVFNGVTVAGRVEEAKAEHIARHDPARVLREVAAKRRIMERHRLATELELQSHFPATEEERRFYPGYLPCVGCGDDGGGCGFKPEFNVDDINKCPELRDLAAVYSDHSEYDPKWAVA